MPRILDIQFLELATRADEGPASRHDLHVQEPGLGDLGDVLSLQESAADSGRPDGDVLPPADGMSRSTTMLAI
jgi:hypothetical protein